MKLILFTALIILGSCFSMYAQNPGKVVGKVVNTVEKATDYSGATVTLLRAKDSAALKFLAAAKDGSFAFEAVSSGSYIVSVTSVGHKKVYSNIFEITPDNASIQLAPLQIIPVSKSMAGVTVTAKKPLIEQKIDRTIINVEASVTNVGTNALEVLEKSPGIIVDKDGNISLKGKEGVVVMIDGRPTQLGGADLANLLRNMNSSQMDVVEIMTNPPARYDASGNAGVINIKTKKNTTAGYNGSLSLSYTQGRYPKTTEGLNYNFRQGKVAVFTNFNHNYRKNFETLSIQRSLRNSSTSGVINYFDQRGDRIMEGASYNAKVGMDYFYSKKTTLGVVFNGFYSPSSSSNINNTNISSSAKELQSVTNAKVNSDQSWKNFSTNLNFRRALNNTGKELTADLDFSSYQSGHDLYMVNSYYSASGVASDKADSIQGSLPQNIKIYSGRVDYLHPMKKGAKFEAGVKSLIVRTDNNAVYDSIQFGTIVHDYNRSNHFEYEEAINSAYVNLSTPLSKKISAQFGLRLENTATNGYQKTTGVEFERDYTQLFPTAYFQYKRNEKNNFGLNYGRRLRRPDYQSLNPFIRFIDRYTYTQGNPDLKPQFSHNIELSHTYRNTLTTTFNYTATNDIFQDVIQQKGQEAYVRIENIASLRQYGLAVSYNTPITKWWTNNIYVNVYNNHFEGIVNSEPISFSGTTFTVNGSQQFKLSKTGTAEINGLYRSAGVEGVILSKSRGILSVGYSQQIMKTKGTVRLTVRDIFYTMKGRATARYGNVDAAIQQTRDSRVVALGFTYRFSKGKMNSQRKRIAGSANEEQERVGMD